MAGLVVDAVTELVAQAGARRAFGVSGGAVAPFVDALRRTGLDVVHTRHESGASFMACEAFFSSSAPGVVFTTSGPGLTNALTGLAAAAWDGAKILAVVGGTRHASRGRFAFQETGPEQVGSIAGLGPNIHCGVIDSPQSAAKEHHRLQAAFAAIAGSVTVLVLPDDVARQPQPSLAPAPPFEMLAPRPRDVEQVAGALRSSTFAIWLGFGARHCAPAVLKIAEQTGCLVMASPRAKGTFPEHHPQYIGVTGVFGHESVHRALAAAAPEHLLVLGSRLGEFTSSYDAAYLPSSKLFHIDVDSEVFARAYPQAKTVGIQAEAGAFTNALEVALGSARAHARPPLASPCACRPSPIEEHGVDPRALMQALQSHIVDTSDALILTEAGNAFAWGTHALRFATSGRYRTSTGFAAMGHAGAGVVGAALETGRKAVAVLGDGAMLMTNEINTAVQHHAKAVWVVLNDQQYGMVHHGMRAIGLPTTATQIPAVDFVAFAKSQGAAGVRVDRPQQLQEALQQAMASPLPFVVDVQIDPSIPPPFGTRNERLQ